MMAEYGGGKDAGGGQNNTRNGQYGIITEKRTKNTENTCCPGYVGVSKFE
jgi:hypothetical protein